MPQALYFEPTVKRAGTAGLSHKTIRRRRRRRSVIATAEHHSEKNDTATTPTAAAAAEAAEAAEKETTTTASNTTATTNVVEEETRNVLPPSNVKAAALDEPAEESCCTFSPKPHDETETEQLAELVAQKIRSLQEKLQREQKLRAAAEERLDRFDRAAEQMRHVQKERAARTLQLESENAKLQLQWQTERDDRSKIQQDYLAEQFKCATLKQQLQNEQEAHKIALATKVDELEAAQSQLQTTLRLQVQARERAQERVLSLEQQLAAAQEALRIERERNSSHSVNVNTSSNTPGSNKTTANARSTKRTMTTMRPTIQVVMTPATMDDRRDDASSSVTSANPHPPGWSAVKGFSAIRRRQRNNKKDTTSLSSTTMTTKRNKRQRRDERDTVSLSSTRQQQRQQQPTYLGTKLYFRHSRRKKKGNAIAVPCKELAEGPRVDHI